MNKKQLKNTLISNYQLIQSGRLKDNILALPIRSCSNFMVCMAFLIFFVQKQTCLELFTMVNDTEIKQNKMLTTITNLPQEYNLSFDFKPTAYLNQTANVIHLTMMGDHSKYGYRTPAVWISSTNTLTFASAINGSTNTIFNSFITPPINEWIHIKISQINFLNRYVFAVDVANKNIYTTTNILSKSFDYVRVYVADPWYSAQPGFIRKMVVADIKSDTNIRLRPVINVSISGLLTDKSFLFLNTTICNVNKTDVVAYNLTLKYMLPYYSKILSQSGSYLDKGSTYKQTAI
ncbi:uncharacterized protein LOC124807778 [Hydra vulgaris]|uniref:uncharacterized protein LOC124807778 n=1 Tax=Hydra vulgaris TaxID=6087 RepID=UPI0032EA0E43